MKFLYIEAYLNYHYRMCFCDAKWTTKKINYKAHWLTSSQIQLLCFTVILKDIEKWSVGAWGLSGKTVWGSHVMTWKTSRCRCKKSMARSSTYPMTCRIWTSRYQKETLIYCSKCFFCLHVRLKYVAARFVFVV